MFAFIWRLLAPLLAFFGVTHLPKRILVTSDEFALISRCEDAKEALAQFKAVDMHMQITAENARVDLAHLEDQQEQLEETLADARRRVSEDTDRSIFQRLIHGEGLPAIMAAIPTYERQADGENPVDHLAKAKYDIQALADALRPARFWAPFEGLESTPCDHLLAASCGVEPAILRAALVRQDGEYRLSDEAYFVVYEKLACLTDMFSPFTECSRNAALMCSALEDYTEACELCGTPERVDRLERHRTFCNSRTMKTIVPALEAPRDALRLTTDERRDVQ